MPLPSPHPYITTGKTIGLTRRAFVGKGGKRLGNHYSVQAYPNYMLLHGMYAKKKKKMEVLSMI